LTGDQPPGHVTRGSPGTACARSTVYRPGLLTCCPLNQRMLMIFDTLGVPLASSANNM